MSGCPAPACIIATCAPRRGPTTRLSDIHASADLVLIDAPCTGTGTWRRNPDAKWRMRPGALEVRLKDQVTVLDRAAALTKPGGRIAYITCSVLPPENNDQIRSFVARHPDFAVVPPAQTMSVLWDKADDFAAATLQSPEGLLMTPRRTGTDGFFVSVLKGRLCPKSDKPASVIPGRCAASNPESRDSGSGAGAPSRNDGLSPTTGYPQKPVPPALSGVATPFPVA